MRGVRNQLTELISGLAVQDMAPMSLGLSHSLSRYKLKFSAEKVYFLLTFYVIRIEVIIVLVPFFNSVFLLITLTSCRFFILYPTMLFIKAFSPNMVIDW